MKSWYTWFAEAITLFRFASYSGDDVAKIGMVPTGNRSLDTPKLSVGLCARPVDGLLAFPTLVGVTSKLKMK